MKSQWMLLLSFVFALIIIVFAIANVESVEFNYLFGTMSTPLILIIALSTLFGGLTVGLLGMLRIYVLQRKVKQYEKLWQQHGLEPVDVKLTKKKASAAATTTSAAHHDHNQEQESTKSNNVDEGSSSDSDGSSGASGE